MINQFSFQEFLPDAELEALCQRRLDRLRDLAPYGSYSAALLRKDPEGFHASIDVYSFCGPFSAQAYALSAQDAVERVCQHLEQKLHHWKSSRIFTGSLGSPDRPRLAS